jgi:hypothetical protein
MWLGEAAGVAATLEQVAEAVEHRPATDSADALLHRLQPLRGLGALPSLSPLPELLETLDLTIAFACRGGAWPREAGRAFRATAAALARMARDIAELAFPSMTPMRSFRRPTCCAKRSRTSRTWWTSRPSSSTGTPRASSGAGCPRVREPGRAVWPWSSPAWPIGFATPWVS